MTAKTEDSSEYLTKDLFKSIISKHLVSTPFQVVNLEHTPAVAEGENFFSKILRNRVEIQLADGVVKVFSFITKIVGATLFDSKMIDDMKIFPKEVKLYLDVVPELEQIWKERAGIDITFGPKLYYHELEPRKILIFEDLTVAGYKMESRFDGLTEEQVFVTLKKISKWHAASQIYLDRHEHQLEPMFRKGAFTSVMNNYARSCYPLLHVNLIEALSIAEVDEVYINALKSWKGQIVENINKSVDFNRTDFNVFTHGDLWINNLMYTVDSSKTTDVKFIDYQLAFHGSPVVEVLYFLIMATHHELFVNKFDEFFAYYHSQLVESLKELNYSKWPSLKELCITMLQRSFYISVAIIFLLPSVLSDHKLHGIDVSVVDQNNDIGYAMRKKMFEDPNVLSALKALVKFLGNRGMLDL